MTEWIQDYMVSEYGMKEVWLGGDYPEDDNDSLGASGKSSKDNVVGGDKKRDVAEQKEDKVWSKPSRSGVFTVDASELPHVSAREMKKHAKVNIFVSSDFYTADKLLVIVQGSGAVRPGQWARALCINHSLKAGTIFDYLDIARELGMATIVLNPNQERLKLRVKSEEHPLGVFDGVHNYPILGHENHVKHILYVWDHFVAKSPAKDIWIVAHSRGGDSTLQLLNHRLPDTLIAYVDSDEEAEAPSAPLASSKSKQSASKPKYTTGDSKIEKKVGTIEIAPEEEEETVDEEEVDDDEEAGSDFRRRVRAIAFTDSVHWIGSASSPEVVEWMSENARDWVASKAPLDAPEHGHRGGAGCDCFSSGHEKHEWTSPCAVNSIFKFFLAKGSDTTTGGLTFKERVIPFSNPPQNVPAAQKEEKEGEQAEESTKSLSYADIAAGKRKSVSVSQSIPASPPVPSNVAPTTNNVAPEEPAHEKPEPAREAPVKSEAGEHSNNKPTSAASNAHSAPNSAQVATASSSHAPNADTTNGMHSAKPSTAAPSHTPTPGHTKRAPTAESSSTSSTLLYGSIGAVLAAFIGVALFLRSKGRK